MQILSIKPGHDSNACVVKEGKLIAHIESEKSSFERHNKPSVHMFYESLAWCSGIPDIIASSGWHPNGPFEASYLGFDTKFITERRILGKQVLSFSSTHERSHIFMSYGMSPYDQGTPCYLLTWEGGLGKFYEITENLEIKPFPITMKCPGFKYALGFGVADWDQKTNLHLDAAGKVMALASYSDSHEPDRDEDELASYIISEANSEIPNLTQFTGSPFFRIGVESEKFKRFARVMSDKIFDVFYTFAKQHCTKGYPLLIGGGCGLNCEWNSKWMDSELFDSVFIPPCTNDSGSAIGTAIDAQYHFTNNAKIEWNTYAGEEFRFDKVLSDVYDAYPLDTKLVAKLLYDGLILGWARGRYEIGPRALGNRSIIASPLNATTRDLLNEIKGRESYRPIAPICMQEQAMELFGIEESPYMLLFTKCKEAKLAAITHVDGSSRVQTLRKEDNPLFHQLLGDFRSLSGFGVLCNTSLNMRGRGFINSSSELEQFQKDCGLDGFVAGNSLYLVKTDG